MDVWGYFQYKSKQARNVPSIPAGTQALGSGQLTKAL